jgi:hypothetical protein
MPEGTTHKAGDASLSRLVEKADRVAGRGPGGAGIFDFKVCGKNHFDCHSERSEESLCSQTLGKERFLGTQRASE